MSSIKKHWNDALFNLYNRINIDDTQELIKHLKINTKKTIVMIDEQSTSDIKDLLTMLNSMTHVDILLFNAVPEVHHASTLLGQNVKGYENAFLHKINLIKMLQSVQNGKNWLFADLTSHIINKFIQNNAKNEPEFVEKLTNKEKDIALMIADGFSNKEIAQAEKIALSTVKGHIHKIFAKAGVSDRVSLALKFK
jgi:DNA-binding NarL/FixJ family response regulator